VDRRRFLHVVGLGAVAAGVVPALTACQPVDNGPLGPLLPPDANGLRLPAGFTSRVIATSGEAVATTGYVWPGFPDGGAVFTEPDGGWTYVANSEIPSGLGGASRIRFDSAGNVVEASRILTGTTKNCAGGATPWRTWLSCEETTRGKVWECDPAGVAAAVERTAMGRFRHEAAAADPLNHCVYLSEDEPDGALYRFVPTTWGDLSAGRLDVLVGTAPGTGTWTQVPDPSAAVVRTALQVPGTMRFNGGEGLAFGGDRVFLSTKGDNRIWSIVPGGPTAAVSILYDAGTLPSPVLTGVDNITTSILGDRWVAEDGGDLQVCRINPAGEVEAALQLTGVIDTELTGPAFAPGGRRLYFSSQRNPGRTYEVTGPFPRLG
jgi:hypothetical protein